MKNRPFHQRLSFALDGIREAWKREASFRAHSFFVAVLLAGLAWLRPAPVWWALLLGVTGLVLAAELINTALETIIDHLHPEQHPMMKVAKDCAAGAVLVTVLAALAVFIAFLAEAWYGSIR